MRIAPKTSLSKSNDHDSGLFSAADLGGVILATLQGPWASHGRGMKKPDLFSQHSPTDNNKLLQGETGPITRCIVQQ